jgi:hypothetical protein
MAEAFEEAKELRIAPLRRDIQRYECNYVSVGLL